MNVPDYIEKLQERGRLSFTLNHLLEVFKEPKASLVAKLYYLRKKGRIVSPLQGFYIIKRAVKPFSSGKGYKAVGFLIEC